jgi:thiamine pyrophosphate-dependent acetolactate synthase large subunit-like protein
MSQLVGSSQATVSTRIVEALQALGVRRAFGLPGVHNLAVWSALRDSSLELVGVRHEQTAVYAADGYARASGALGVALTTTGPGAANAVAATGEAWTCGTPVLVIATDIPSTLRRPGVHRGVLHETRNQAAMFAAVVKATIRIDDAATAGRKLVAAGILALTAPTGPVYVDMPTDLLLAPSDDEDHIAVPELQRPPDQFAQDELTAAAAILAEARRPLIWAGGGTVQSGADAELEHLAQVLGAPVLETWAGRGIVSPSHPSWVGYAPHFREVGSLWDDADAVLAVGTEFDGPITQNWALPAPPSLVAINVSRLDATKAYEPAVVLQADARRALDSLTEVVKTVGDWPRDPWADLPTFRAALKTRLERESAEAMAVMADLEHSVPADMHITVDMCILGYWIGAARRFAAPRLLAYPIGWGTLGFGFPAAIGTALAAGRRTLCVCGDGGFLYAAGELAVLAEVRPELTILIVDDGGYGMLRFDQHSAGEVPFGVDLATPDFVALAKSFGIPARRVPGAGQALRDAMGEALASEGPNVVVLDAALQPPETTSPRWPRAGRGK